jgi:hypothetical protein
MQNQFIDKKQAVGNLLKSVLRGILSARMFTLPNQTVKQKFCIFVSTYFNFNNFSKFRS